MANFISWFLVVFAILHLLVGVIRFRPAFVEAVKSGFVGQFSTLELRKTAFWFMISGLLVMLIGHLGIQAASQGDLRFFKTTGIYLFVVSMLGISAVPKSPFWGLLLASLGCLACGFEWVNW